ncbi:MAG: hypothetical protein ACF8MF_10345 [Phycisphaerales bacterium JB052]
MATITRNTKRSRLNWTPRQLKRQALTLCACGVIAVSMSPSTALASGDGSFWTQFTPSVDTRLIFVSSSEGSDSNSGLTPERPVKSLERAYELLRDGYPDWMLLKRGDVWTEGFPFWTKSGRAEDEKLVVGAYGEAAERPQIRPDGSSSVLGNHGEEIVEHVAFVGLHLEPMNRQQDEGAVGISWKRESNDILFEDLFVSGFTNNITLQAWPSDNLVQNLRLNGCVIVDSWNANGHSQGLFANLVSGLTIENCVFDHNGWSTESGAAPTIYNHNVYIQYSAENVRAYNNIFMRGAATGIQMRSGGELVNNLLIANPVGFHFGAPHGYDMGYGVDAVAKHNTILHGTSIQNSQGSPRSIGAYTYNSKNVTISENIFAHNEIGYNGQMIIAAGSDNGSDATNIDISNNFAYAWHGSIKVTLEQTPDDADLIQIRNNKFIFDLDSNNGNNNFNKSIINIGQDVDYVFTTDNTYAVYGMHSSPFKHGSSISTAEWQTQYEPTASFGELSQAPNALTISDYLESIGTPGDIEDFASMARSLSRSNVNGKISPTSVYSWYLENFNREAN